MAKVTNTSDAPRVFNLRDGVKRTLAPGESADLDLAVPVKQDRVLSALLRQGQLREGIVAPPTRPIEDEIVAAEVEAAAAVARARALRDG